MKLWIPKIYSKHEVYEYFLNVVTTAQDNVVSAKDTKEQDLKDYYQEVPALKNEYLQVNKKFIHNTGEER